MEKNRLFIIFNGISIYIYWWLCIWGVSIGNYFIGPILAILYFLIHFIIIRNKSKEIIYMFICILTGFVVESILYYSGFLDYKGLITQSLPIVAPWVILLWGGYGLTVYHSFRWILGKYYISFIGGGIFGPFIYISGNQIGAISLTYNLWISYFILMPILALSILFLNYISVKINE